MVKKNISKKKDKYKMNGNSYNPQEELLNLLISKFPDIFTEGKVDPKKLKATLGEIITSDSERYGLSWAGKSDCFRHIQEPTTATLKPVKKESVDFDTTQNLFIEGDNLEVLKVLQKSYYNKIKMIYIDPPYNTGNDSFIYPDRFQESQEEYLKRAGEIDEEGNLMKDGMFQKNSKDSGHFHSNWLSMIYPRLFLARNLLKQDGVIFVSIDDNEVHNLRLLMNEVFGEENFVGQISIQSNPRGRQSEKFLATVHDYILIYSKNNEFCRISGSLLTEEQLNEFKYTDKENKKYRLLGLRQRGSASLREERPLMHYPIYVNPKTGKISLSKGKNFNICVLPKKSTGQEGRWMWSKEKVAKEIELVEAKLIHTRKQWDIFVKDYLEKGGEERTRKIKTIWFEKEYNNQNGTVEVKNVFNGEKVFEFPKAVGLLKALIGFIPFDENDIIIDFFSGSATTAHAVFDLNKEDGGNRKCISVQLPEPCDEKSEAYKSGYKTIADIGKERIRRVGKKIKKEKEGQLDFDGKKLDTGFKVFKLDESNFKIWRTDLKDKKELIKQMDMFVDNVKKESTQENILYELILKSGLDLNVPMEKKKYDGKQYFSLDDGKLIVCLEDKITQKLTDVILSAKPEKVICLDKAFGKNDQLKTNTILQMESAKIDFKVI